MTNETENSLEWALRILTTAHTEDDPELDFIVQRYAVLNEVSQDEYVRAWEIARSYLREKAIDKALEQ